MFKVYIDFFFFFFKEHIRRENQCDNDIVLPLIFYSDSTLLSKKGSKSGWPLVMSIANIPIHLRRRPGGYKLLALIPNSPKEMDSSKSKVHVFNRCLDVIFEPLKKLSFEGLIYKGSTLYPCLYSYVQDYPEGCKVVLFF